MKLVGLIDTQDYGKKYIGGNGSPSIVALVQRWNIAPVEEYNPEGKDKWVLNFIGAHGKWQLNYKIRVESSW